MESFLVVTFHSVPSTSYNLNNQHIPNNLLKNKNVAHIALFRYRLERSKKKEAIENAHKVESC